MGKSNVITAETDISSNKDTSNEDSDAIDLEELANQVNALSNNTETYESIPEGTVIDVADIEDEVFTSSSQDLNILYKTNKVNFLTNNNSFSNFIDSLNLEIDASGDIDGLIHFKGTSMVVTVGENETVASILQYFADEDFNESYVDDPSKSELTINGVGIYKKITIEDLIKELGFDLNEFNLKDAEDNSSIYEFGKSYNEGAGITVTMNEAKDDCGILIRTIDNVTVGIALKNNIISNLEIRY